jgi:hypothetical protein
MESIDKKRSRSANNDRQQPLSQKPKYEDIRTILRSHFPPDFRYDYDYDAEFFLVEGLGQDRIGNIRKLCELLAHNSIVVRSLILEMVSPLFRGILDDECVKYICQALETNTTIRELSLACNSI